MIEESIVGNLEERLLRFLADPAFEWEAMVVAGVGEEFRSQIASKYASAESLPTNPRQWAEDFVMAMIAAEVFVATGKPPDFPFIAKLPLEPKRKPIQEFLNRWMHNTDFVETFARWSKSVEKTLNLRTWASGKPGRPDSLLSIADARWRAFFIGLQEQGANEALIQQYLKEQKELTDQEAKGFWAKSTRDLPGWELAVQLSGLVEKVSRAVDLVSKLKSSSEIVKAYTSDWHRIDLAHWRLLAAARKSDEVELLASIADRFYVKYLDATGRAFYDSFRDSTQWPPEYQFRRGTTAGCEA